MSGGYWGEGGFVSFPRRTGWAEGGYNIYGEYIPPGDTWNAAVGEAAIDLVPGLAANALAVSGFYDAYKVGRDLVKRPRVDKSKYVQVDPMDYKKARLDDRQFIGRKRAANTDLTRPDTEVLKGSKIIVGNSANFTSSRKRCRISSGKKGNALSRALTQLSKTVVWRWQSMYPINDVTGPLNRQSLLLNSPSLFAAHDDPFDPDQPLLTALPMYAFDLGTLPCNQGTNPSTKTRFSLESVPMYRLYKRYYQFGVNAGVALSTGTHNYVWYPQNGYNNGGGGYFEGKADYLWNQEYSEAFPASYGAVKQNYTAFDMLFKCGTNTACKIHTSIVNFKNGSGPDRLFCENQNYNGSVNMTTTKYGFEDDNVRNDEQTSHRDTFWEAFWDSKVTHPLSSFKGKWGNWIKFIKDDEIQVRPPTDNIVEPYHHKLSYVVADGGMQSFDDNTQADHVDSDNQPPVFPYLNFDGTNCAFDRAWGYNQELRYAKPQVLYQDGTRDKNCWLLIWMDELRPSILNRVERKVIGSNEDAWFAKFNRPVGPDHQDEAYCCSFDLRVRKHCTYYRDLF